jgi:hypothetical protein
VSRPSEAGRSGAVAPRALAIWYSGWHHGLAHKHFLDLKKGREAEHGVIVYCKDHPDEKIIHAIGVMFKDMRAEMGIKMK